MLSCNIIFATTYEVTYCISLCLLSFTQVIEPVLKVHRAYRYVTKQPHCDRYVLCQLNDPDQYSAEESRGLISGVSPKIVKVGSMGAAFFISTETGTPFWTLFSVITAASNCEVSTNK